MAIVPQTYTINDVCNHVTAQCKQVERIEARRCEGPDENYVITITPVSQPPEAISLFSLAGKTREVANRALKTKIDHYFAWKDRTTVLRFVSGALLDNQTGLNMEVVDGQLVLNGNQVVIRTEHLHSYTHFTAKLYDGRILELSDDHDTVREDGNEGFFFNLEDQKEILTLYCQKDAVPPPLATREEHT